MNSWQSAWKILKKMERRLEKNRGHTLYQSHALFITVRMRTTMSAAHVSRQPWSAVSALLAFISMV